MILLADENIHTHIIQILRSAGFSGMSIQELSKGIKDEQFIRWAIDENLTILTEDKDFGEWVFAHHIKNISVIFYVILMTITKRSRKRFPTFCKCRH
jgi:predicted nuclease of predicted toxin-antitoxin system